MEEALDLSFDRLLMMMMTIYIYIVTRRRGRRRKKLLDDLKDRRGYCQLKEKALDRTMWRNHFGRGFGPVVDRLLMMMMMMMMHITTKSILL